MWVCIDKKREPEQSLGVLLVKVDFSGWHYSQLERCLMLVRSHNPEALSPYTLTNPSIGNHSQRAIVIHQFGAKLVNLVPQQRPPLLLLSSLSRLPQPSIFIAFFFLALVHSWLGTVPAPFERAPDCDYLSANIHTVLCIILCTALTSHLM